MAKRKLGLWTSAALVVGNTIGSGIFLAPAVLARYGSISLLGWLVSALGAYFLARVFINFHDFVPGKSGGPYTYSRIGLGDFGGFQVAWGYWISVWATNATISIATIGYLGVFFPILQENLLLAILVGLAIVWSLVWLNTRGIKEAGIFQLITTILKVAPLIAIGIFGLFFVQWQNFSPFNTGFVGNFEAITACAALTLFSFLGVESATIPAEEVENAEKVVSKATLFGFILTVIIYFVTSFVVMGIIPNAELSESSAPFADVARRMWGKPGEWIIAAGAVFSTLGALNGWILIQGQIPAIAARDKLFPQIFGKLNTRKAPVGSLVISSLFISVLMLMNYTRGLVGAFKFALLLASMTALIAYLYTAVSLALTAYRNGLRGPALAKQMVSAIFAFLFGLWAIIGSGQEVVFWGFIMLLLGVPVYAVLKGKESTTD